MEISSEAKEDLIEFEIEVRERLLDEIEEKLREGTEEESISYIHKPEFGVEFHRLKLTDDSLDHRVYFDYLDSDIIVFAVRHRDFAYSEEDMREVEQRLENMESS